MPEQNANQFCTGGSGLNFLGGPYTLMNICRTIKFLKLNFKLVLHHCIM